MNKKADTLSYRELILIVVSVIAFIFFVSCAKNILTPLFFNPDESYNDLIASIGEVADNPDLELKATVLNIDDKSAVIGFTKETSQIEMGFFRKGERVLFRYFIKKPNECKDNPSCICLCKGMGKSAEDTTATAEGVAYKTKEVICEDITCAGFDFSILKEYEEKCENNNEVCLASKGGFIIERGVSEIFGITGLGRESISERTVYIEKDKDKGIIAVCEEKPCLPETINNINP